MQLTEPRSLQVSPYGKMALTVLRAALVAVEPGAAVRRQVRCQGDSLHVGGQTYDLAAVERIWVVGGGKAATAMSAALFGVLGHRLSGGLVVTKYGHRDPHLETGPVEVVEAGHPIPDGAGVAGTGRIADLLATATKCDLVLAVISGGGSALLTLPAAGLTLTDLQDTTDLLLRSGATIGELNAVRKHLSQIKGGGLARLAGQAPLASLILSDVVGDPLDVIASGPTVADPTTFADAWTVLERYNLVARVPAAVRARLRAGVDGILPETSKPDTALLRQVHNVVVGSNRLAAEAAVQAANEAGLNALLLSTFVEGEARQVARVAAALAKELVTCDRPVSRPACLVWGGETTVTVRGRGKGGRNQELALAAAMSMAGLSGVLLVALGTDGTDGPTDAAGAVASGDTVARAHSIGLDPVAYLENNDAYPFFDALGDLLRTGPTGTNVNDLLFLFAFAEMQNRIEPARPAGSEARSMSLEGAFSDEQARAAWDEGAQAWEEFVESGADYYRHGLHGPALLAVCEPSSGLRILDLGCGQGFFCRELARRGARVVGIDISEQQLAYARRHEAKDPLAIEYRLMSAGEVDQQWTAGSFDLVAACMALHDMADPASALRGAYRVLGEGGRMVFSVPHPCTDTPYREWEVDGAGQPGALKINHYFESGARVCHWSMRRLIYHWDTPYWRHTIAGWSALIAEAGFLIRRLYEPRPTEEQVAGNRHIEDARRLPSFLIFDLVKMGGQACPPSESPPREW